MAWCRIGDKSLSEPIADPIHWRMYEALGGDELNTTSVSSNDEFGTIQTTLQDDVDSVCCSNEL